MIRFLTTMRYLIIVLVLLTVAVQAKPALALSISDYFTISYTIEFSKTQVQASETFQATVTGTAICKAELPITLSAAEITTRVVAKHQESGTEVVLNPGFTVTISPFPAKPGDVREEAQVVPLVFPAGSQPGPYQVLGELVDAKVKVSIGWLTVTSWLPATQVMGTVTVVTPGGSGGSGGGGGGGGGSPTPTPVPTLPPGTTDVSGSVDAQGVFTKQVIAKSPDGKDSLTINQGTKGLTKSGKPLDKVTIAQVAAPPVPPENAQIVGSTYDLGPDDATFDPPIALTLAYNKSQIPEGIAEQNLVVAFLDVSSGKWTPLSGAAVDPENSTITVAVSHFTTFSVMAYTRPAAFTIRNLSITPSEARIGEKITITAVVLNTGDLTGSLDIKVKIDDTMIAIRTVTLAGGASELMTFTTTTDTPGTFTVSVNELTGTLVVEKPATFVVNSLSITPAQVEPGKEVTITAVITNIGDAAGSYEVNLKVDNSIVTTKKVTLKAAASETVIFTTAKSESGTYNVDVNGLRGAFVVNAPSSPPVPPTTVIPEPTPTPTAPVPPEVINWWLVGGILGGCIALAIIAYLFTRRRRTNRL